MHIKVVITSLFVLVINSGCVNKNVDYELNSDETLKANNSGISTTSTMSNTSLVSASYNYSYLNADNISIIKEKIINKSPLFVDAYQKIIEKAELALVRAPNPVTNKPVPSASGDLHDYLSLGPYWWPNPDKADGLPWIRKDGQVNPKTRGNHTDQQRARIFLQDLGHLNLAYIYNGDVKYLLKAKELIHLWLIDPKTKMNPHLNYAQGVPGESTGRPFGVIEWESISEVATSVELLKIHNIVDTNFIDNSDRWLAKYLNWLLTSEIGMQEGATKNNHANWYDYQVIGLMIHLGQIAKATEYTNTVKSKRIDLQIATDGAQPHELARTKSINYSSMNLMALLSVAELGKKVGVDLLNYSGEKGQSIKKAAQYLIPFVQGNKQWEHKQIGSVKSAFEKKTIPAFYVVNSLFNEDVVPKGIIQENLSYVKPEIILTMYPFL